MIALLRIAVASLLLCRLAVSGENGLRSARKSHAKQDPTDPGADQSPPCLPLEDKVAIVIGQDFESIRNYTSFFASNAQPFGLMAYTSLRNEYGNLAGLAEPIDYGSGIEWVQGLVDTYPKSSIQLGLWLVGQLEAVVAGELDASINALADFFASTKTPFYLRIGYEFDSPENNYSPVLYQRAFQYIVTRIRAAGNKHVHMVWHSSGFPTHNQMAHSEWFPGEDFVDWCGVSLFQQPYDCTRSYCLLELPDQFAAFCKDKHLPLMIAESTPFGGILDDSVSRANPDAANEAGIKGGSWSRWFLPVISYIQRHNIRMWCYINCDWDMQPMWAQRHEKGVAWGDTRLENFPNMAEKWRKLVLGSHRSLTSYAFNADTCSNAPAQNVTDDGNSIVHKLNALLSGNSTDYKQHGRRSFQESIEIRARDVLLVVLKFVEVLILLLFTSVVFVLVVACVYKVYNQYYLARDGYTTIQ